MSSPTIFRHAPGMPASRAWWNLTNSMHVVTPRIALQQGWTGAGPRAADCLLRRRIHREHVVAVDERSRNAVARGDRQPGADDAIGPKHPHVEVCDVHRAAFAPAVTVNPAEQLRHHAIDIGAFGNTVPVAAVVAHDAIGALVCTDADRARFLATVRVMP